MIDIRRVHDWLVRGAPGSVGPAAIVQKLGEELVAIGIPVERIAAYVRTLHPQFMGRAFLWRRGGVVEVKEIAYAILSSDAFKKNPIARVVETGKSLRRRLVDPASPRDFNILEELVGEGFTDYLAAPLTFMSGQVHAMTFTSAHPDGFTDEHIAALEDVVAPMSRIAEILALGRTAVNLLNTYVGRNAGERIIAGNIQLGDTDTIRAAIWFSDLRGFTTLASSVEPAALIRVLNDLFECQVPAIEKNGGEVLKFMGDGLLAIFPWDGDAAKAPSVCDAAFSAALASFEALAALNAKRIARGDEAIRFGLALHVGDVAYGNIGGAGRLDFTCIGPAVNVASRLEGLTGRLEQPLVASAEFARLTTHAMTELGAFELKGVAEPQTVFAPTNAGIAK